MIISIFLMLFTIIVFFMFNYRNGFTKIISLYFVTIAVMTVIGIVYVSRFSDYYSLIKLDYKIYFFLSAIRIPLSALARTYNLSLVLFMLDNVIFMNCLHKMNIKKIAVIVVPLVFFCVYNDPAVSKYLYLEAAVQKDIDIFAYMNIGNRICKISLYIYMILPFVSMFFYCRQTRIFVKRKDAMVSCCCISAINMFVLFVFINGVYDVILFDNVNMVRLPNEYSMSSNIWLPVPMLTIMIFVITLTLLFRPFQVFNKMSGSETNRRTSHFNKNVSAVFHMYKNAFLGISQQYTLAEANIKNNETAAALDNIKTGCEIASEHMRMLNKILGSLNHIKTNLQVMNLNDCVKNASQKLETVCGIKPEINADCECVEIIGDKNHLTEVFYNLLINSADALNEKGGDAKIKVNIICENNLVLVSVFDNGCGIKHRDIHKIFQPFFSTKSTGSGVGLNYVSNMVKQHHGEIKVKSSFGQYTLIQIVLPVYTISRRKKWIR